MTREEFESLPLDAPAPTRVCHPLSLRYGTVGGKMYTTRPADPPALVHVLFDGVRYADGKPAGDYVPYEELEIVPEGAA